jgi:hypothetical protein
MQLLVLVNFSRIGIGWGGGHLDFTGLVHSSYLIYHLLGFIRCHVWICWSIIVSIPCKQMVMSRLFFELVVFYKHVVPLQIIQNFLYGATKTTIIWRVFWILTIAICVWVNFWARISCPLKSLRIKLYWPCDFFLSIRHQETSYSDLRQRFWNLDFWITKSSVIVTRVIIIG